MVKDSGYYNGNYYHSIIWNCSSCHLILKQIRTLTENVADVTITETAVKMPNSIIWRDAATSR
jgi:hypothetical protein